LAMAKAVVASSPALAALQTQPGVHLLAAHSADEWTNAVLTVLEDDGIRRSLGTAGRKFVEKHHHWDRCLEPLSDILGLTSGERFSHARPAASMPGHKELAFQEEN